MNWNIFKDENKLEKIKKRLKKLPWNVDVNIVIELLKPCISIKTKIPFEKISIGKSKFGGLPDLPTETIWPNLNGFPFAFIAQINLEEIKFDTENKLPKKGILYFFFSTNQTDYQYESFEKIHKVLYFDNKTNNLKTSEYPKKYNELAKFKECSVEFYEHYSLPSYQNYQIIENGFTDEDENLLFEANEIICEITTANQDIGHQSLGSANAVQGDVSCYWANQESSIQNEKIENKKLEFQKNEKDIILLLQIDMLDENPEFNKFGASGGIYFGIRKQDLENQNFEKTKFTIQNS
ncbi:YwqG family protein [Flavobacterium sp. SUN052]|uniref:YwqG family protein n=1 Tax=Flavobacterium sp. SUN052 TaxID=3002441 RepID=UPI00237EBE2D|nr:YwqG family protein [Flavobacterium sp. SUN052]MEC4005251.1 YwqG family protein [Flavobacterium sp. SUN052]